jgi:hypothetical protein
MGMMETEVESIGYKRATAPLGRHREKNDGCINFGISALVNCSFMHGFIGIGLKCVESSKCWRGTSNRSSNEQICLNVLKINWILELLAGQVQHEQGSVYRVYAESDLLQYNGSASITKDYIYSHGSCR